MITTNNEEKERKREINISRYKFFKTGKWKEPELPDFPELTCQNTRYILRCKKLGIYFQLKTGNKDFDRMQAELLPNEPQNTNLQYILNTQ